MDGLQVAADGLGAKRHGAVDPGADEGRTPAFDVAAEAGRNFDRGVDVAALHARVQIGVTSQRRFLDEVGRAAQFLEVGAAFMALVMVEHRESQVVDVGRDAETEHQHEEGGAEQGESQPDRIADQLDGFANGVGEKPPRAENALWR